MGERPLVRRRNGSAGRKDGGQIVTELMKKNGGMNLCRGWRADSMGLSRDDPDFDTAIAVDYGAVASAAAMRKTLGMATLPATKDPLAIVNLAHAYGVERHHPKDAYDRLMMPQKAERRAEAKKESKKRKRKERGEEPGAKRVKFLSVIEDYDHARSMYTPVYFYGEHLLQKASAEAAENCYLLDSSAQGDIRKMARKSSNTLPPTTKSHSTFFLGRPSLDSLEFEMRLLQYFSRISPKVGRMLQMTLTVGAVQGRLIGGLLRIVELHTVQKQYCLCLQQLRWPSMSDLRSISSMAGGEKPSLLFLCITMKSGSMGTSEGATTKSARLWAFITQ